MKDKLYLLKPGFENAAGAMLYCSDSAPVEGVLSFFPRLRELVDVAYLEHPRPRKVLVEMLGADHQSLPVLVLSPDSPAGADAPAPKLAHGNRFFDDEKSIRQYLSARYELPMPG
jgi:hypothetical protein